MLSNQINAWSKCRHVRYLMKSIKLARCLLPWLTRRRLYFLREVCLGDFFSGGSWFEFFLIRESRSKIIKFSHVRVWRTELNVTRDLFCFAWWVHDFLLFWKWIVDERFWLSFDLGLDRTWTLYGSIKAINQISNGSWKSSTRTKFLHCFCWHDIL